jgi:hypothetical protein
MSTTFDVEAPAEDDKEDGDEDSFAASPAALSIWIVASTLFVMIQFVM